MLGQLIHVFQNASHHLQTNSSNLNRKNKTEKQLSPEVVKTGKAEILKV
jgi:hypothetical protein